MDLELDRSQGSLLGLAVGDAVGTTLEFKAKDTYEHITDMVGGGPFSLPVGAWTDDTSMALCLAVSLLEQNGFNAADQMRRYRRWQLQGYLSSTGVCFDIGGTVSEALDKFATTGEPNSGSTAVSSAGNGSLMRLAPVVEFYYPDREKVLHYARESSRTTHGAAECLDACSIFSDLLFRAIVGVDKSRILDSVQVDAGSDYTKRIANMEFKNLGRDQINGSGYVMESLEAALWCFYSTNSFEEAILLAANLGDDADTTAAICGQIAGAHYGASGIPNHWINKLVMKEDIVAISKRLYRVNVSLMTDQYCPICRNRVKHQPRYPAYICRPCLSDGVEVNGEIIPASKVDVYFNAYVDCKVQGVDCVAHEAYFGGTVIQAK